MLTDQNKSLLRQVLPLYCTSYLESQNWEKKAYIANLGELWKLKVSNNEVSVIVPLDVHLVDYTNRIVDIIKVLSEVENKSFDMILNNILHANDDILRIIAYKGTSRSDLPLIDAASLISSSLEMVSSIAQSLNTPRPYFSSRHSKEVDDYLNNLKMGHTEKGSFIVTIFSHTSPRLKNLFSPLEKTTELLSMDDEPMERRVMANLSKLIPIAINAANTGDEKSFSDSINKGMSANFCEALARITSICGDDGANLDISWAPSRPIMPYWKLTSNFSIQQDTASVLREAAQYLRKSVPEKATIEGYVIKLEQNRNDTEGEIKLVDILSETRRNVFVKLENEAYQKAIDAHKSGSKIRIVGCVEKTARKQYIEKPSSFEVLSDNSEY